MIRTVIGVDIFTLEYVNFFQFRLEFENERREVTESSVFIRKCTKH